MGSIPPELTLEVRPTFIPKTISDFLGGLTTIGSVSERLSRLDEFVKRLEEEMRKIDAFKRELPLCMLLLKDAIVTLREESMQCRTRNVQPVLEEFIPLKKNCDDSEKSKAEKEEDNREKKNWMSSVQLWNTDDCKNIDSNDDSKQKSVAKFVKGSEEECSSVADDPFQSIISRTEPRSFVPFKGCSVFPAVVSRKEEKSDLPVAGLSLLTPGIIKNPREEIGSSGMSSKTSGSRAVSSSALNGQSNLRAGPQPLQQQTARKQRRCWSPELHRRFVNALQQLGGSQVATPKQIRELMQVDGLTNDEVKSHLQKFRLHTRRVPTSTATPANEDMVILGGLWMPHDRYVESSKQNSTQSGSPQGPLQLARTGGGTSTTEGDSMEEEEDEKSESYSWKSQSRKCGNDAV